eukprot:TRINITY_DN19486_c0_g1_i1.p1 TRINITY_DN19486_c0_g1~~TRINITY_DN19486_c0_g1_i1.p1  ORF type:complete len:361 (+),score=38.55 TRINITY_DN19486_c0_g1_i1:91-1173(+)
MKKGESGVELGAGAATDLETAPPSSAPVPGRSSQIWVILILCMCIYNGFYVCFDMLGVQVMSGSSVANPAWTVLFTEIGKFCVSGLLLLLGQLCQSEDTAPLLGSRGACSWSDITNTAKSMTIPAGCYASIDVLNLCGLGAVSLSHFAALHQTGVFFTAFASIVLIQDFILTRQKMLALVLLFIGGVFNAMNDQGGVSEDGTTTLGACIVIMAAFISAVGAVCNEKVVRSRMSMDPNIQNMLLYSQTTTAISIYVCCHRAYTGSWGGVLHLDRRVAVLVFLKIGLGLAVSRIIKYGGAMMKQFSASIHIPIEVLIAHMVLHTEMGALTLAGAVFIAVASCLYFSSVNVYEYCTSYLKRNN